MCVSSEGSLVVVEGHLTLVEAEHGGWNRQSLRLPQAGCAKVFARLYVYTVHREFGSDMSDLQTSTAQSPYAGLFGTSNFYTFPFLKVIKRGSIRGLCCLGKITSFCAP
jgi:hypothetical protein